MADQKIFQLTAATTPLGGTEVLPIVQSGSTVKVAVDNLTAGRTVSASTFTSTVATGTAPFTVTSTTQVANLTAANATTASNLKSNATTGVMQVVGPAAASTRVMTIPDANFTTARTDAAQTFTGNQQFSNSVGVGGAPNVQFEVTSASGGIARITGTGGTVPQLQIVSGGVVNWSLRTNQAAASDFTIYQDSVERLRIASGGNITSLATYSATVGGTNRDVFVDSTGLIGYVSSIRASKINIQPLVTLNWLYQLTPVSFNYRKKDEQGSYTSDADGPTQYGLIAEDTEKFNPDLCFYDDVDGEKHLRGVSYTKLIVPMLKAIQDLRAEVDSLKAQLLDAR